MQCLHLGLLDGFLGRGGLRTFGSGRGTFRDARTGTFLEINANPWRLDLDDRNAAAAKAAGVKIVISTDAHSTRGLDVMRCGILQARRAGLEAKDVANTRTLAGLRRLMGR